MAKKECKKKITFFSRVKATILWIMDLIKIFIQILYKFAIYLYTRKWKHSEIFETCILIWLIASVIAPKHW